MDFFTFLSVVLSFLPFIAVSVSQAPPAYCPVGWAEFGVRCYRVEVRQWLSYSEAAKSCEYRSAALAGLPDGNTVQFITNLLNTTWSQSNQCLLQRRDCQLSASSNYSTINLCSQDPCLSLWVGLVRDTPCGASCSPGSSQARSGWRWADGTPYDPSSSPWASGQPLDDRVSVRFGPSDSSMVMNLQSYDELQRLSFVCSRLKNSTDYAGPEFPEEGLGGGSGGPDKNYNVRIGLSIGLSVGLALLIVIIAIIAVIIGECRRKPRKKVADDVQMRGSADTLPVHYPTKRDTIYFSNNQYGAHGEAYGEEGQQYGDYMQDPEPPYKYPASEA